MNEIYTTPQHTPPHWFLPNAIYMVTGSTLYQKPFLDTDAKKAMFCETLINRSRFHGWELEAWAVMPTHYHFVSRAPDNAASLKMLIQGLHSITAKFINAVDKTPGRQVWYNYWDSCITYEHSYYARLNYVHSNPVKHGLVENAEDYPFCSYSWFLKTGSIEFQKQVFDQPIDKMNIKDDF